MGLKCTIDLTIKILSEPNIMSFHNRPDSGNRTNEQQYHWYSKVASNEAVMNVQVKNPLMKIIYNQGQILGDKEW